MVDVTQIIMKDYTYDKIMSDYVMYITKCKQGMTVFRKTSYTEFHETIPASHVHG